MYIKANVTKVGEFDCRFIVIHNYCMVASICINVVWHYKKVERCVVLCQTSLMLVMLVDGTEFEMIMIIFDVERLMDYVCKWQ